VAGKHHFTDYWARDGFFAAFGALKIGDKEIVDKMVDLFFRHQRKDGLIPYRIMNGPVTIGKYFGKPSFYKIPKPTYKLRGLGAEVLDGTTLTIIFADKEKYKAEIKLAINYLRTREKDGLLWDGVMGEWNDCVLKWGNLLYTNLLYWKMFVELKDDLNAKRVADNIRKILWNGKYFADWKDYKRQDCFYSFGNYLAVAWGLTTREETKSIMTIVTRETNVPKYPWWRVDPLQRMLGMADYHNGGVRWWQPVCAYVMALKATGKNKEAEKIIREIENKIVEDGGVWECYEKNGKPVKRLIYRAEQPFAWGAGMILNTKL